MNPGEIKAGDTVYLTDEGLKYWNRAFQEKRELNHDVGFTVLSTDSNFFLLDISRFVFNPLPGYFLRDEIMKRVYYDVIDGAIL